MSTENKHAHRQKTEVQVHGVEPMADTDKPDTEQRIDRIVFLAKDTPAEFFTQLEAIAAGDFAAAGLANPEDERAD